MEYLILINKTKGFHRMVSWTTWLFVCFLTLTTPGLGQYSVHQCNNSMGLLRQMGACRLGGCLDNEYRLPGEGVCGDVKSSLWAVFLCVDTLPCCSRGGACRYACAPVEKPINTTTDCTASGAQCCVLGEDTRTRRREMVARRQGACGRTLEALGGPRIIGGRVGRSRDWPWVARLVNPAIPGQGIISSSCAGVLVDDDTVLTVAHCVSGIGTRDLKVVLGDFDVTVSEPEEESYDVRSIEVNPRFVLGVRGNDFAVIKLARPVTFTAQKLPACLPDPDIPIVGGASGGRDSASDVAANHCFIAGWGKTERGQASPKLRTAPVILLDTVTCNAILQAVSGNFGSYLPSDILCTDTAATNTDACLFDDGGMLVCLDVKNRYSLLGLVSEYSCGRLPTLFTRVSNYTRPVLARL